MSRTSSDQSRPGACPRRPAHVVEVEHRGAVDRHGGVHSGLHARRRHDRCGRHELVAGGPDRAAGQPHRAGPDDPQRPRWHEVRRALSRCWPVREFRNESARTFPPSPGAGGLWLVRHPDVDRWWQRCTRSLACSGMDQPGTEADTLGFLGITIGQFLCFLAFWAVHVAIVADGHPVDQVGRGVRGAVPDRCAAWRLLVWAFVRKSMTSRRSSTTGGRRCPRACPSGAIFFPQLTAMVGFWATLSLNIPDFTRYCRSQRDQAMGQL